MSSTAVPLAIRLHTARRDMVITREAQDLTFRSTAPGGFASASVPLERPLSFTPDELNYYGKLYVEDKRNGDVVWEGWTDQLGRGADANGQVWTITAVGPSAHVHDRTVPLIYQDLDLSGWVPAPDAPPWMDAGNIDTTAYGPGLQVHAPRGTVVAASSVFPAWRYTPIGDAGLNLGGITFTYGEDATDSNWTWALTVASGGGTSHAFASTAPSAGSIALGSNYSLPAGYADLSLVRGAAGVTVGNDSTAASFVRIVARSTLFSAAGSEILAAPGPLHASTVVADLLGRLLALYDGTGAFIDTSSDYLITDQFAYPDGVTADQVLADLMTFLPDNYWAAWESNAAGLYRFEWKPWPTTVRYDATAADGFSSPGSSTDVYNEVFVRWTDKDGSHTYRQFQPNDILGAVVRTARIDLGSNVGGGNAAAQAAQQFLDSHAVPPASGTLAIARPIYDRVECRYVQPWEILPGYLVRVKDVAPVHAGQDRDGTTTFRVVAMDFEQSTNTAQLELDAPAVSLVNQATGVLRELATSLRG
jgi:hypothetical protein